ncbi:hypothetical protein BGZ49_005837 [Haplosporangium sp. Z 27]|nr:hypothetical protein BGZ49_005837 [Haplosporangium sp. Z 27]
MNRLDKMLTFIWDHQRLFGTLRELKIENKTVPMEEQPSRLIELVEAMGDRLEVLDVQFWPEAVLYMDRIPTAQLKSLLLHTYKFPAPVFKESSSMAMFLSQCPRLQEISMYTGEKDLLRAWKQGLWAHSVSDPKISLTSTFQQSSINGAHRDNTYSRTLGMTEMKKINVVGLTQNVISITNDASALFTSSLEVLIARSWFSGKHTTTPLSWAGSTLSQLTDLDLEGEVAWTFDYGSLLGCPRLSRIRLAFTGPMPSRSLKKQPTIDNLPRIVNLKDLELVGNWETLFVRGWPGVIARLCHLERLDLTGCEGISAEHVYSIVHDTIDHSAQWREDMTDSDDIFQEYVYCYCRLRWVIINKRLEDAIKRLWDDFKRQIGCLTYTPRVFAAKIMAVPVPMPVETRVSVSPFVRASVERIHFSFVVTARPSH